MLCLLLFREESKQAFCLDARLRCLTAWPASQGLLLQSIVGQIVKEKEWEDKTKNCRESAEKVEPSWGTVYTCYIQTEMSFIIHGDCQ